MGRYWENCWKCGGRTESAVCVTCGAYAEDDPLVGRRFGRFKLTHLLSHEPDSLFYRAKAGAADAAVRIPPTALHSSSEAVRAFRDARQRHAFIRHPAVTPVIDQGEEAGVPWYAVEWVDGEGLGEFIESRPELLSVVRVIDMAVQMANGLDALHEVGAVHTRICPWTFRNVAGFSGMSDWLRIVHTGANAGPVAMGGLKLHADPAFDLDTYWTPYQLPTLGSAPLDEIGIENDVFALAATFYHVLTGGVPFMARRGGQSRRIVPPQERRPGLFHHRELIKVVELALSNRHRERFATAVEFRRALEATRDEAVHVEATVSGSRRARPGTSPRMAAIKRGTGPSKKMERRAVVKRQTARPVGAIKRPTSNLPVVERNSSGRTSSSQQRRRPVGENDLDDMAAAIVAQAAVMKPQTPSVPEGAPSTPVESASPAEAAESPPPVAVTPPEAEANAGRKATAAEGLPSDSSQKQEVPLIRPPSPESVGLPTQHRVADAIDRSQHRLTQALNLLSDHLHRQLMEDIVRHGRFELTQDDDGPPDSDALFGA